MLFYFMGTLATDLKIEGSHFVQFVLINFLLNHRPPLGSIWSVCLSINVWLRGWKSNSGLICTGWLGFDEQQFHFCFPLLKKKMPLLQEDQQQQALHCMSMLAPITSYWLKYMIIGFAIRLWRLCILLDCSFMKEGFWCKVALSNFTVLIWKCSLTESKCRQTSQDTNAFTERTQLDLYIRIQANWQINKHEIMKPRTTAFS